MIPGADAGGRRLDAGRWGQHARCPALEGPVISAFPSRGNRRVRSQEWRSTTATAECCSTLGHLSPRCCFFVLFCFVFLKNSRTVPRSARTTRLRSLGGDSTTFRHRERKKISWPPRPILSFSLVKGKIIYSNLWKKGASTPVNFW